MDKQERIIFWLDTSTIICLFLFAILFLIVKFIIINKKKNRVQNILTLNDFSEIIGSKQQLTKNIKEYFKTIFIRDVSINLFKKFLKSETGSNKIQTKIAWEFYILLITSVLTNDSNGKISEAVTSIRNVFKESKKLLLVSNGGTLLTDVILKIMNLKIRPILVSTRTLPQKIINNSFIIDDDKLKTNEINDFWNQVNKVRKELIEEKFLYFFSILSLSEQTNEQINDLLNCSNSNSVTQEIKQKVELELKQQKLLDLSLLNVNGLNQDTLNKVQELEYLEIDNLSKLSNYQYLQQSSGSSFKDFELVQEKKSEKNKKQQKQSRSNSLC